MKMCDRAADRIFYATTSITCWTHSLTMEELRTQTTRKDRAVLFM